MFFSPLFLKVKITPLDGIKAVLSLEFSPFTDRAKFRTDKYTPTDTGHDAIWGVSQ